MNAKIWIRQGFLQKMYTLNLNANDIKTTHLINHAVLVSLDAAEKFLSHTCKIFTNQAENKILKLIGSVRNRSGNRKK